MLSAVKSSGHFVRLFILVLCLFFFLVSQNVLVNHCFSPLRSSFADDHGEEPRVLVNKKQQSAAFPPVCTEKEREIVRQDFPPGDSKKLTSCPDPSWFDDYLYDSFYLDEYRHADEKRPLMSISVGCNKGDDAVLTLRKLSGNTQVDADAYTAKLREITKLNKRACRGASPGLHHPITIQHPNIVKYNRSTGAIVHCIEAMPNTAQAVRDAVASFAWRDDFYVASKCIKI